ncbi:hypothetical protein HDEF_0882 [Candidatus Hamiltonella defensa 5AT (Acyrthosiphon pisum)]|uniref:Uncharacterized protein n=1 Tax=Hamiltonella defensa subsp. Acyrthosiphon pisum (strain 5AT) TaxID=572265 RepID=C4K4V8_HAMD5|nr:hypothetical protein HDEF_0882 [Candidatus Hamiltonella defensa 5AT (Acyrthosiphon pisum)]
MTLSMSDNIQDLPSVQTIFEGQMIFPRARRPHRTHPPP